MLDIRFIRDNAELVAQKSAQKGYTVDIQKLLELDTHRRSLQATIDQLRTRRNENAAKMKGGKPEQPVIDEGKKIKIQLAEQEDELIKIEGEYFYMLKQVPNLPLDHVPVGTSEENNVITKEVGQRPEFDFAIKNHYQLALARDWIDKERASKVAGARFAYLKGDLVRLHFALIQYGLDVVTDEAILQKIIDDNGLKTTNKAFVPVMPPAVARTEVYDATGRLNKEEQTYKLADDDLWLNASAEHTMAPMFLGEILEEAQLPIRLAGYTTAFRREAGTYGKDMEGILRMHQFDKLEMESFTTPESGLEEHKLMIAIQEYLMQQLGVPYRVLQKCTADIGGPNAAGVDIDSWLPAQGKYRETHTADYITDYQARRMNTRLRRINEGGIELVHTNDATVFSQRPLIAIIENFQTADGTVRIPEVLRPYMSQRRSI